MWHGRYWLVMRLVMIILYFLICAFQRGKQCFWLFVYLFSVLKICLRSTFGAAVHGVILRKKQMLATPKKIPKVAFNACSPNEKNKLLLFSYPLFPQFTIETNGALLLISSMKTIYRSSNSLWPTDWSLSSSLVDQFYSLLKVISMRMLST